MGIEGHIDRFYDERLREVQTQVSRIAERVDNMIRDAADAVLHADDALAQRTLAESAGIEQLERTLDRECLVMLATRAPVASDLAFVMTAMRVATELGRMSDLAKAICERAVDPGAELDARDRADIAEMAAILRSMLHEAVLAFTVRDGERAQQVISRDAAVNERYQHVFDRTIELMSRDAESVRSGVHIQAVAKRFERMADHVVRVADAVVNMLDGNPNGRRRGMAVNEQP
jgi:phosphate transport system protein